MRAILLTLIGLAAAACGLILAPAGLASAADSAIVTIGQLEAQGFDGRDRGGVVPVIVDRTVTVSLDCSRR
jgi:hypothetical protein